MKHKTDDLSHYHIVFIGLPRFGIGGRTPHPWRPKPEAEAETSEGDRRCLTPNHIPTPTSIAC